MAPIKCETRLEKSSKIFFPGEAIKGHVIIYLKSATRISVMNLHLIGEARFGEDKFEIYRETKSVEMNKILPSGTDKFPITWPLPSEIPSTFNWKSGSLSYYFLTEITSGRSGGGGGTFSSIIGRDQTQSAITTIEIQNAIDLNELPREFQSSQAYNQSYFHGTNAESETETTVVLDFVVNRRCFIPGEYLKFDCSVAYDSNSRDRLRKFQGVRVFLEQEDSYFKDGDIHTIKSKIWQKIGPSIKPNDTTLWESSLKIPNHCMSTPLDHSGLVCVQYFLNVSALLWHSSESEQPQFRIPIVVGMIPLEEQNQNEGGHTHGHMGRTSNQNQVGGELRENLMETSVDSMDEQNFQDYIREAQLEDVLLPDYDYCTHSPSFEFETSRPETPPPSYEEAIFLTMNDHSKNLSKIDCSKRRLLFHVKNNDKPPNYTP